MCHLNFLYITLHYVKILLESLRLASMAHNTLAAETSEKFTREKTARAADGGLGEEGRLRRDETMGGN